MITLLASIAFAAPTVSGTFTLAEDPAALAAVHAAAVDRAAAQLAWPIRGIGRSKLATNVRNCARIDLSLDADAIRVTCDADAPFTLRAAESGRSVPGRDGEPYTVTFNATDASAKLSFSGASGGQHTIYEPLPDGTLRVTKELFSSYLGEPVRWTVRYRPAN